MLFGCFSDSPFGWNMPIGLNSWRHQGKRSTKHTGSAQSTSRGIASLVMPAQGSRMKQSLPWRCMSLVWEPWCTRVSKIPLPVNSSQAWSLSISCGFFVADFYEEGAAQGEGTIFRKTHPVNVRPKGTIAFIEANCKHHFPGTKLSCFNVMWPLFQLHQTAVVYHVVA